MYTISVAMILPFIIHVFHVFIILFVILVPLIDIIPSFLILHIVGCFSLLVHWYYNDNSCSLTLLECSLRGISKQDALSYRFIAPIYNISDNEWIHLLYIITIILMCISILKLYYNPIIGNVYTRLRALDWNNPDYFKQFLSTSRPLFILKK
jgi:hypothetical protein